MKRIKKNHEPKSLEEYRNDTKTSNSYSEFKNKDAEQCKKDEQANKTNNLRRALLNEQGYICCYCMSRISCYNSKIEHFKPQSLYKELQLDYKNLFIACKGNSSKEQFCDTHKANQELKKINLLEDIEKKNSQNILDILKDVPGIQTAYHDDIFGTYTWLAKKNEGPGF